uniref:Nucleotide exchange factor Fes1 domain-containing protein n=1 Tax=Polytomella parva TaxID=51329 RepID=A0A7S0VY40_9CHLO|mmetsp:Transcript_9441/g.17702  ORF Transcript_9441/g.17702 Transcript_9441/m.17702 type:complete len:527 (+) Transcript_9441:49-1629(+)
MTLPEWKGLWDWTMRQADGTKPSDFSAEKLDPSKMKWLDNVLKEFMVNFSERMSEIKEKLDNTDQSEISSKEIEEREIMMDELLDIICSIDYARDLHRIGGLPTLLLILRGPHVSLSWRAAEIIATCAQNNPPVQKWFLEANALSPLLDVLRRATEIQTFLNRNSNPAVSENVESNVSDVSNSEPHFKNPELPHPDLSAKVLLAVSALVRGHPDGLAALVASGGIELLGSTAAAWIYRGLVSTRSGRVAWPATANSSSMEPTNPLPKGGDQGCQTPRRCLAVARRALTTLQYVLDSAFGDGLLSPSLSLAPSVLSAITHIAFITPALSAATAATVSQKEEEEEEEDLIKDIREAALCLLAALLKSPEFHSGSKAAVEASIGSLVALQRFFDGLSKEAKEARREEVEALGEIRAALRAAPPIRNRGVPTAAAVMIEERRKLILQQQLQQQQRQQNKGGVPIGVKIVSGEGEGVKVRVLEPEAEAKASVPTPMEVEEEGEERGGEQGKQQEEEMSKKQVLLIAAPPPS